MRKRINGNRLMHVLGFNHVVTDKQSVQMCIEEKPWGSFGSGHDAADLHYGVGGGEVQRGLRDARLVHARREPQRAVRLSFAVPHTRAAFMFT